MKKETKTITRERPSPQFMVHSPQVTVVKLLQGLSSKGGAGAALYLR